MGNSADPRHGSWLTREHFGLSGWAIVAAAVLVVVVASIGIFARAQAAPESTWTPAAVDPAPSTSVTEDPLPVALFIGDSYTNGTGASSKAHRWTTLVAKEMGWTEVNYGRGGTGFATTAGMDGCGRESCPAYLGTIEEAVADGVTPDIVVIAGGQNDSVAWFGDADVPAAIEETYQAAADSFPDAQIIAVGPSWLSDDTADWQWEFDEDVQAAAAEVGGEYVSLLDPHVIDVETMSNGDGAHVNNLGHEAIAAQVSSALS